MFLQKTFFASDAMAGIDEDDISDSSEDEAEAQPTAGQAKRPAIYNTDGLHEKLEDFGWSDQVDWLHTLAVTVSGSDEEPVDVENDLARELAFYTQALESAKEAYEKLTERGVPVLRPNDYYAEMVKTDDHMLKVRPGQAFFFSMGIIGCWQSGGTAHWRSWYI